MALTDIIDKEMGNKGLRAIASLGAALAITLSTMSPGSADTLKRHYDRQGNHIGTTTTERYGREDTEQEWVGEHPQARYFNKPFEWVFDEGMKFWNAKRYQEARSAFDYAHYKLNPHDMESYIFSVKSHYQTMKKESGEQAAREETSRILRGMIARIDNEAIAAFNERFIKDKSPMTFTVSSWTQYATGKAAYDKEDYKTASAHFRKAVEGDPWDYDAWFYLASSEQRKTGDKNKRFDIWREGVKYHPSFQEDLDRFAK